MIPPLVIALASIAVLVVVLWIFNKMAWGGGMRQPDLSLYQASEPPSRPGPLPGADPERAEVRCTSCDFRRAMPELAQLPAALSGMVASALSQADVREPCPQCGAPMRLEVNRQISHRDADGTLEFSTLRSGAELRIEVAGATYRSLDEIDDPELRRKIAAALNMNEGTS